MPQYQNNSDASNPPLGGGGAREQILARVKQNQPTQQPLPVIDVLVENKNWVDELTAKLEILHVAVFKVASYNEISTILQNQSKSADRVVTTIPQLTSAATLINSVQEDAHNLENVELAIIPAHFAVAENGAVWITEDIITYRVLPFIAQQLAVVIPKEQIVPNMHIAYDRIANTTYNFGVFIAGPSKTADIEQSLVLGAHGPKGMMAFILG
ncbi:MAG: LUD domain-containing protein [Flavobacterium sp.]|nr:LUD domain-containing protein [Flavobacterium sp.]